MSTATIRLVQTPSGPEVHVDYESDSDALPHEHESDHRRLVEELLGLGPGELAGVTVRTNRAPPAPATSADGAPVAARAKAPLRGNPAPPSRLRRFLRGG